MIRTVEEASNIDFFEYHLVCFGSATYNWHPAELVEKFLKNKFNEYHRKGQVVLGAPKVPGKYALLFCTYSGPHTGVNEAIPVRKYVGQVFEHIGFTILDEWYILSEYHGSEEKSTKGRMGNIKGLPSPDDLNKVKENVKALSSKVV